MSGHSFRLRVVTPLKIKEMDVVHVRLKDRTGFFGVMKGHTDFVTVLEPCLGYYTEADGKEVFLAVDGGILSVRDGVASLTSREVYESSDAEDLAGKIEKTILKRGESETAVRGMLEGLEKAFMEKSIAFVKRGL